ncbi:DUF3857 domain-containing protein [Hydrogenophaga sp.]|uniref:DUF3857 domain-containing protein n=1 Tax=Hydrogenophaga sp. TaxID=1904254 RepID=UPI0026340477|nr:DUF3857 domain-containing protein [Hydrogenophaga sp.]MCW5655080.1 DUF3857 domain-containing protein [Hydrogenophaga sp.]
MLALALSALLGWVADAEAQEPSTLKEIQPAAEAFARGTSVPDWVRLAPLPALSPDRRALVVHLAETQMRAAPMGAWLVQRVVQTNHASTLGALGQVAIRFNPAYQRLALHRLAVLRGSEVIDHTATAPVRFLQRELGLEQGIYSGVITASVTLPDIRVGDALHLVYSVEGSNPIMGARYTDGASWEEDTPVLHRRVTLVAPEQRRIHWRWVGDLPYASDPTPVERVERGERHLVFEGRDIAAVELEPNMPAYVRPVRWLQFSEYERWEDVGEWAADLLRQSEPLPPELDGVLAGLKTQADQATRVAEALRWVQENIRYHSLLLGESSHRPQPLSQMLRVRYGDCKDKSVLLVSMLRALGIEAEPALASLHSRKGMTRMLPSPDVFDHVVVRVRLGDTLHYIDPTRSRQAGPIERMGQHLEDAEVLVARADSKGAEVIRSPNRAQLFRSSLSEHFELDSFESDGVLQAEWVLNGLDAESMRAAMPRLDEADRQRWARAGYERRYPGLAIEQGPSFVDDVALNQMRVVTRYRIPRLARQIDGDWVMNHVAANLQGSLVVPERLSRQFPVWVPSYPATHEYEVRMRWPESVAVVMDPVVRTLESPYFRARTEFSFRGREAARKVRFEALVPEIKPGDLPRLIEDVRKLGRDIGGVFVVERGQIKRAGVLGIGQQSFMDKMREQMQGIVQGTDKAIAGGRLSGEDLAEAYCVRAEARSDLGEAEKGLADAEVAVARVPESARAWNCRGNLNFAVGRFDAAVSDYSRALVMGHDASNNHYRRGIARFYQGRLDQAADDFARATASREDEGDRLYAHLWHIWTLRQLGRDLPTELQAVAQAQPSGAWPRPALALLAGVLSPDELMASLSAKSGDELTMALVEAWFYLGQYHKIGGDKAQAIVSFRKAREPGVTVYIEHVAAGMELQQLEGAPRR